LHICAPWSVEPNLQFVFPDNLLFSAGHAALEVDARLTMAKTLPLAMLAPDFGRTDGTNCLVVGATYMVFEETGIGCYNIGAVRWVLADMLTLSWCCEIHVWKFR
jgi:hypothetical protein